MCCSDYACKSAQHNFFVLSALCAEHSFVHDKEELSSSILRMLIQVPVPWLKSRCGSQCSELNVLVAVATKSLCNVWIALVVHHDTKPSSSMYSIF